jgi:Zn ribbon nucleic-acid-binding protein
VDEVTGECPECGGGRLRAWAEDYTVYYLCPDCGYAGHDGYEDLYGCMAVPWGFLL